MRPGDVVYTTYLRTVGGPTQDGRVRIVHADWSPPKNEHFVLLVLGSQPKDGSYPLDVAAVLKAMGWRPSEELKAQWKRQQGGGGDGRV